MPRKSGLWQVLQAAALSGNFPERIGSRLPILLTGAR